MTKSTAESILEKIRNSRPDPHGIMKVVTSQFEEIKFAKTHLSADSWQEFKRKFILEYGDEPVQSTGMTHSEFLNYIKTSGQRENDEFTGRQRLEALLRRLSDENSSL